MGAHGLKIVVVGYAYGEGVHVFVGRKYSARFVRAIQILKYVVVSVVIFDIK